MNRLLSTTFAAITAVVITSQAAETNESRWFHFDQADEIIPSTMLENPFAYDGGIAASTDGLWLTWLEFVPGKGDELWAGLHDKDGWRSKIKLSETPGDFANPTVTVDSQDKVWVSYEAAVEKGNWDVFIRGRQASSNFSPPQRLSSSSGSDINHRVVKDRHDGLWVVWQSDNSGQFDISICRISTKPVPAHEPATTTLDQNEWSPSAAVLRDGTLQVAWDAHGEHSYDIFAKALTKDWKWTDTHALAATSHSESHAQIASGDDGKLWVCWEEDGENWGERYTARLPGKPTSTHMTDKLGPLHRFRKLHLAQYDEKRSKLIEYDIPQPSFDLARNRTNAPKDLQNFGAFYENAELVVDGKNRPWLVYRHFYAPTIGIELANHKQENKRIYARCLLADGWSKLYSFKEGQGDGMQRISASPTPDGVAVAWTAGRTDRRNTKDPHGIAFAEIKLPDNKALLASKSNPHSVKTITHEPNPFLRHRPSAIVGSKRYELFYGDLHRHTDISLCFSPVEGTIDDAYRYAIDVAPLDFLGITDHTHDLQMGEPLAHIWWRSRKEVDRHALAERFIPFYSYERSRTDTDHNVISLRDDMLRPHTYPLPKFWQELDTNTITIPHQPFNSVLWKNKDNTHRTLLEIYQGMRNNICESDLQEGLSGGHKVGVIASSDHLSTSASFACVWAERPTRESIFRAMQARRTFGATAQISLKVTAGEHWMGESFSVQTMPAIQIEAHGTSKIEAIEVVMDGQTVKRFDGTSENEKVAFQPSTDLTGTHVFFVRLNQADGNHAWSSPLWVDVKP